MKKLLSYLLLSLVVAVLLLMVVSAGAQTTRIKLVQIEKSSTVNGTKANQVPVSNTLGDLRYAQFPEINPVSIGYTPSATGNPVANYSQFVSPANGDVWYIDGEGRGKRLYVAAASGDYDWLEIGNNQIPNAITDSIYKYKYAAIGGRYVWPQAEFVTIDSSNTGLIVISGNRLARVAYYDNVNQTWAATSFGGDAMSTLYPAGGTYSVSTYNGGAPQNPGTPITDHIVINGDSSVQFPQYPSTRTDPGTPTKLWGPDATGRMQNYDVSTINNGVFTSGPVTGSGTSFFPVTLLNSGVTAGSYTNANLTVDGFGRVTACANGSGGGGTIGGSIASGQVAVGSGTNTIAGSSALTFASGLLTVTGNATVAGNGKNTFTPNYTTTISGDYGNGLYGTITGSGTSGHRVVGTSISPAITAGANNQVMTALEVSGSYTPGAFTGTTSNIAAFRDAGVNKVLIKPDSFVVSTPSYFTPPALTGASAINGIDIRQTWNTTGAPNLIYGNVTNTASTGSSLLRLDVGGSNRFTVGPTGIIYVGSNFGKFIAAIGTGGSQTASGAGWRIASGFTTENGTTQLQLSNGNGSRNSTSGNNDFLNITETFAAPAGSANYRPISVNYTLNNSGAQTGTATGIFLNATETALNGMTHNLMNLQSTSISRFIISNVGKVTFDATYTPSGTTTVQTINKPSGSINMAAGTLGINVNNSLVSANSIVICTVQTNDATAQIKNVTPGGGVFTINLASACTSETKIGFVVFN